MQKTILRRGLNDSNIDLYLILEKKINDYNAVQTLKMEESNESETRYWERCNTGRSFTGTSLQASGIRENC